MTNLTEAAKNFSVSAKQQRQATEKVVSKEFQRLKTVIAKESKSAAQTSKNAIQSQAWKAAAWQSWSVIPLLVTFTLGLIVAFALTSGHKFKIVSTFQNKQGVWIECPILSDNEKYCLIEEAD